MIKNEAKGTIWYGMHFYPGCAEYADNGNSYRVFLNDDTIRAMGPSFAGKPVFVLHVDEVEEDLNKLRSEADGWVIESFYNQADGKHWVKFIVCSEKGEQAIKKGFRLSNCYMPKGFGAGGTWNGISYDKEVTGGDYEHLAIVPNPRYEESVIMTPEKFKEYNDNKLNELKKFANNKDEGKKMKFNFFKRQKVENSTELDGMCVVLPNSKKEVFLEKLINEADEREMKKDEPKMVDMKDLVEIDGEKLSVDELVKQFNAAKCNKKNEDEDEDDDDSEDPAAMNSEDEDKKENEDDEEEKKVEDSKKNEEEDDEEEEEKKKNKKKNAKDKADRLRNADKKPTQFVARVDLSMDQVARGKKLFGSDN